MMKARLITWASCLAVTLMWGCSDDDDEPSGSGAHTGGAAGTGGNGAAAPGGNGAAAPGSNPAGGNPAGGHPAGGNPPGGTAGTAPRETGGAPGTGGRSSTGGGAGGASHYHGGGAWYGYGGAQSRSAGGRSARGEGGAPGDRFDPPGTNPFVVVAHDPLSTFAADSDTASYDIFRRDIAAGHLPNPASVRIEEYVNFFEYDYAPPAVDSTTPFSVHLAAARHLLDRDTTLFRVGIQGKVAPPAQEKPAANLVFLVDVSGSMSGPSGLPLAKYVLRQSLEVLDPDDTVSIVSYSDDVTVALEPTPASETETILAVINGLRAGGSTAGAAALGAAYEQAAGGFIEGGMNHVVMCTDGDFNVGPSSTEAMVELIEEKRETGITLAVLGFGFGNLNDKMMEAVSNKGDGVYSHISSQEIADEYVAERLLSNMYFIAKNMKIQVEFNPEEVYAYRLLGYENRAISDGGFRNDSIDGGEVGAGHRVTALYELVLPGGEIPLPVGAPPATDGDAYAGVVEIAPADLALVKVRYQERNAAAGDPALEVAVSLAPGDVAPVVGDLDASFQWAVAIASYAEILKQSPYGDPSQLDLLGQLIRRPIHEAYDDRVEFVGLFTQSLEYFESPTTGEGGAGGADPGGSSGVSGAAGAGI